MLIVKVGSTTESAVIYQRSVPASSQLIPLIPKHSNIIREVVQVVAVQCDIDAIERNHLMRAHLYYRISNQRQRGWMY